MLVDVKPDQRNSVLAPRLSEEMRLPRRNLQILPLDEATDQN